MHRLGSCRTGRGRGSATCVAAGLGAVLLISLITIGCGKKADGKTAPAGAAHAPGAMAKGKPGGPPPEAPTNVAVDPATRGTAQQRYATTATLEAENRAELLARTGGVVAGLLVDEGSPVRAGQDLLLLDDSEAKLRVRQAEVSLAKMKSIHDRQKASFDQQVISQADYDVARTNLEAAQADLDLAQHQLSYTRVPAPFTGTIVRRSVNVGQTVNIGTPLFEIASFHPLLAHIFVPAKELGTLQNGQEADLVLDSNGAKLRGAVRLVSPVADPNTGTVKVRIDIKDYPPGTRPGDFVQVSVVTARHDNVVRVPNLAVFEDRGERIVYVARDTVALRKPVQTGFADDTHTEIVTGIEAGERVIVKGQRSLKDGSPIRILDGATDAAQARVADRQGS